MITPIQGRLLVELKGEFDNITTTQGRGMAEEKYTRGIVHAIAADIAKQCEEFAEPIAVDSMVYFGAYEDNTKAKINGNPAALIKLEEIGGVE